MKTDQEINEAIVERCGWVGVRKFRKNQDTTILVGYGPHNPFPHDLGEQEIPNYCSDLNAMQSAVLCHGEVFIGQFSDMLIDVAKALGKRVVELTSKDWAVIFLKLKGDL